MSAKVLNQSCSQYKGIGLCSKARIGLFFCLTQQGNGPYCVRDYKYKFLLLILHLSTSFHCIAEMAASHFLQVQVKSQVISLQVQVKSQVISVQVQVKSQVISLQVQVKSQVIWSDVKSSQVTSHLVRRQVKSSHKSFGPNTSQVTSLFVQVQVKSN